MQTAPIPSKFTPPRLPRIVHRSRLIERLGKTVDTRETQRTFFAPLEQVASAHLDIQAAQLGYRQGGPSRVLL